MNFNLIENRIMANEKSKNKRLTLLPASKTKKSEKTTDLPACCCSLCFEEIENIKINCHSCLKPFHLECAGFNRLEYRIQEKKDSWVCSIECIQSNSKTKSSGSGKKVSAPQKIDQNNLLSTISDLQTQIKNLTDFQETLSKKYEELVSLHSKAFNENGNIKDINLESNKAKDLSELKYEINLLKQYNIRKNIVIKGINVEEGDDPLALFMKIANFLNVDIYERDIEKIYVKHTEIKDKQNSRIFSTIYVNFFDFQIKRTFIKSRKGRKITPLDLQVSGLKNIIIEDQLTQENSYLLKEAKNILRRYDCKFIWVLNGQICYRYNENSQHYIINSLNHLREIESKIISDC